MITEKIVFLNNANKSLESTMNFVGKFHDSLLVQAKIDMGLIGVVIILLTTILYIEVLHLFFEDSKIRKIIVESNSTDLIQVVLFLGSIFSVCTLPFFIFNFITCVFNPEYYIIYDLLDKL